MERHLKLICAVCRGSGWLCDEHPTLPWDHDSCDGAGVVCGCNAFAVAPHKEVFVDYDTVDDGARWALVVAPWIGTGSANAAATARRARGRPSGSRRR